MSETVALPVSLVERLTRALEQLDRRLTQPPLHGPGEGLLTLDQVAAYLQTSAREVQRMVRKGRLKKVPNLGARTTRFRPQDVEALVAGGREHLPGRRRL